MNPIQTILAFCALSALSIGSVQAGSVLADGFPDSSFGNAGDVTIFHDQGGGNTDNNPTAVIDSLDRIITFAQVTQGTTTVIGMSRHLSDGTPDITLGPGGKKILDLGVLSGTLRTPKALRAPDGKFYLLLRAAITNTDDRFALCRLSVAGALDPSFSGDGCANIFSFNQIGRDIPMALDFDPNGTEGRIVIGGYADTATGTEVVLVRVNGINGSIDGNFGNGYVRVALNGVTEGRLNALKVLPDSRVVFAGAARPLNKNNFDVLSGRLTADGELDVSYFGGGWRRFAIDQDGASSVLSNDIVRGLSVDRRTGALTIAGFAGKANGSLGFVARLTSTGAFDTSGFVTNGLALYDFGNIQSGLFTDVRVDGRKRIYLYGNSDRPTSELDLVVIRLLSTGFIDPSFGELGRSFIDIVGANRLNFSTELDFSHGKPLLVGTTQLVGNDVDLNLTRLFVDLIFADGLD